MNSLRPSKSVFSIAATALVLFATSSPAAARVEDFLGSWRNQTRNAEITTLTVTRDRAGVYVEAFGVCPQRDCNWGSVRGELYADGPQRDPFRDGQAISATFNTGFGTKLVIIRLGGGAGINVDIFSTAGGRGRQASYFVSHRMQPDRGRPGPGAGPGPGPGPGFPGGGQRNDWWQAQYGQTYTYRDDPYYQRCRTNVDPAGVIAGALIGGLLGGVISDGDAGPTIAGIVLGGVAGAALTQNLDCEDQSYAYRTYYDGLNARQPNRSYQWRNPRNNHYGTFNVGQYYNDPRGFNCATYSQIIYINGRPQEATGQACQQPDGTWVIVS